MGENPWWCQKGRAPKVGLVGGSDLMIRDRSLESWRGLGKSSEKAANFRLMKYPELIQAGAPVPWLCKPWPISIDSTIKHGGVPYVNYQKVLHLHKNQSSLMSKYPINILLKSIKIHYTSWRLPLNPISGWNFIAALKTRFRIGLRSWHHFQCFLHRKPGGKSGSTEWFL